MNSPVKCSPRIVAHNSTKIASLLKAIALVGMCIVSDAVSFGQQKTAQVLVHGKSVQLLPSSAITVPGVGDVTAYFSSFNGTSGALLVDSRTGIVSGELRPRANTPGLYEGGYAQATPLVLVDFGSYTVSIPTLDADGNGIPDVIQYERDGNFTATGSGFSTAAGLTFSMSIRFDRRAGSASGNYTATTQNSAGQVNTVTGVYSLLSYQGTVTYSRGTANTMAFSVTGLFPGAETVTGSTTYSTGHTDQLSYAAFALRSAAGSVYQVRAGTMTRLGGSYRGNLSLVDGLPQTPWVDFTDYVFALSDPNDADGNGIPDLTDPGATPPVITAQPRAQTVNVGQSVTFSVTAIGAQSYRWTRSGIQISDGTNSSLTIASAQTSNAGIYAVIVTNAAGSTASTAATLTVNTVPTRPTFSAQPASLTAARGQTVVLVVEATGTPSPSLQWRKDGVALTGSTNATLILAGVSAAIGGNYTCVASNSLGSATSAVAVLSVSDTSDIGRLINLSILTTLNDSGANFTMGTVVGGAGTSGRKPLLLRAAGPSLAQFGINVVHTDPKLEVFSGSSKIGENDNWDGESAIAAAFLQLGAFPYLDVSTKDAALFNPAVSMGNLSIRVSSVGTTSGTVIAEIYDATRTVEYASTTPRLINVSVLKPISTDAPLTAGFVLGGSTATTVLVRAVGPGLIQFGVTGVASDPQLSLFRGGDSSVHATNDNWGTASGLSDTFAQVGAFALPIGSPDAALLVTLPPGSYTAQVTSVTGSAGTALVETYEIPRARISSLPTSLSRQDLVAFYPFNANASDVSGNRNDGTVRGAAPTTNRFGEANSAYNFNGANASILCNAGNLPLGNSSRTLSLWAKAAPPSGKNLVGLVEWGAAGVRQTFGISAQFVPLVYQAKSFGGGNDVSSGQIADERWHHLAVTFSGGSLSIFVDGVPRGSALVLVNTVSGPVRIGVGVEGGNYFAGDLDDIRIYSRALTAGEIAELFRLESDGTALP